jgi:putative hydrolase of the HAD superfamily
LLFHEHYHGRLQSIDQQQLFETVRVADGGGYSRRGDVFSDLAASLPWRSAPTSEEVGAFWDSTFPLCAVASEGLFDLLDYLLSRSIAVGIVTNGRVAIQNAKIDVLGLRSCMQSIVISEEAGVEKPDAAIFRLALGQLNAAARDTVFVGDNPIADVQGAEGAGLVPVWFEGLQSWPDELPRPRLRITSMTQLIQHL